MKKLILLPAVAALILFSCQKKTTTPDPDPEPAPATTGGNPVTTASLSIYLVDTARVKKISETGTGEQTLLSKTINSSSYIMSFDISPDGTKFVYTISQSSFSGGMGVYTKEVRLANADGSGDQLLYSVPGGTDYIGATRFGSNNKIYYMLETYPGARLYSVNTDGTGNTQLTTWSNVTDISVDGKYLMASINTGTNNKVQIIDRTGDGGFGSQYHMENFAPVAFAEMGRGCFTADGKKAVIPYKDGNDVKIRIIDMVAKTSSTQVIVANAPSGNLLLRLAMASDNDRGILTVSSDAPDVSRSYIFKLSTATVSGSFANNDGNIISVKPY